MKAFLFYVGNLLLSSIVLLLVVITILFLLLEIAPGDPVQTLVGDTPVSPAFREQITASFGLDRPIWERYFVYVGNVFTGNLGVSFGTHATPVSDLIGDRIWNTVALAVPSIILSTIGSIFLGVVAARTRRPWLDKLVSGGSVAFFSIPNFWLGLMLIVLFAMTLGWLPVQGMGPYGQEGIYPAYLVLPLITMATSELAYKTRIMRSSMIESLGQDYIDTARSKGLSMRRVIWNHAFPNALLPMVTVIGYSLGYILAGSVLVEQVFGWPGMGLLFLNAVHRQDNFVVLGVVIVLTVTILAVNIVTDIFYGIVDPRLRARFRMGGGAPTKRGGMGGDTPDGSAESNLLSTTKIGTSA
ncbi:peptide ABC transporter permease [Pseudoclavibacter endophyticus]|uniref:ABC transporter permease n=1 Tax=Pseudoclavibacter endophyticus TaxID=1778590 RepID=UPI0016633368|nr:ABC transporter permease [Pseudoclavibacter endophyticus]GGA60915.1 peptide ABC transporter permease [Pseudoclavibacter endophyticus]